MYLQLSAQKVLIKQVYESQSYSMQCSPHHQNDGECHAAVPVSCSFCANRKRPSNNSHIKAYKLPVTATLCNQGWKKTIFGEKSFEVLRIFLAFSV